MFMTTKTHERILDAAIIKEQKDAAFDLVSAQNSLVRSMIIIDALEAKITQMQHFYNKGRAVHNSDVRYEAKKRLAKTGKLYAS